VRESYQSGGPLRYAIVDGMNVRDSRVHNYPPRWNGAPSQELLVIRRNHQTREPQPIYQQGARARCAARLRAQGSRCEGVSPHPGGVGPYAPMAGVPRLARGTAHNSHVLLEALVLPKLPKAIPIGHVEGPALLK
jgi:hypothetical protein